MGDCKFFCFFLGPSVLNLAALKYQWGRPKKHAGPKNRKYEFHRRVTGPKDEAYVFVRGRQKPGSRNSRPISAEQHKARGGEQKAAVLKGVICDRARGILSG